jgi:hypothetical protein
MMNTDTTTDYKFATYGGQTFPELQGQTGRIVKRESTGIWITVKDTYLNGDPIDTAFAYGIAETVLHHFFGHPYYAERATVFAAHGEYDAFND